MRVACAILALAAAVGAAGISDEQFYEMPRLFHLDHYEECLAARGVYCVGSFELAPDEPSPLYQLMQLHSSNWVDNFNHTRLHRGLCVSRRCELDDEHQPMDAWFASCVNASTMSAYNLSARLYHLEYCERGAGPAPAPPLTTSERAFAGVLATLLALAAVSTGLDLTLTDHAKKSMSWALSWSLRESWRALCAAPPSTGVDLQALDGLRVLGLLCFVIEHVCWLNTLTYIVNTRHVEKMRSETDVMLVSNSTLMVQAFFLMSAFLLANKLLQQRRRQQRLAVCSTILDTMLNRIVRMSPTYFMVVWFASSWWARGGAGPLWAPLVAGEAAVCRRKWWTHLLYLNNLLLADDKCLIQTWYLAADMQLYLCALLLTLALWRLRRAALLVLGALLVAVVLATGAAAYAWHLVPTFVLHRPEAVRALYSGDLSFNLLYQSPLGNAPGALAGLLLAHLHHALLDANVRLSDYRWFRWAAWWAPWLALWWVALSPKLLGAGPPARAAAAALAAGERAVFAIFVATALLGAMHGVKS
ncbi:O-acyltransferase like protein-like [Ostrinia nubilalis]|uniref:O-acyltransferase like protein-like n=1 Tax=Ostrinia nubilalis TaxID=29057 RepID=UPI0030825342